MPLDPNGFYAQMRDNVAFTLLQQFGFPAGVVVTTGDVFDPITGNVTSPGQQFVFPCQAVYGAGYTGKRAGATSEREGNTLVRKHTKEAFLDASLLTIIPSPDDMFQDENGELFEILRVEATVPGGVVVLWRATVVK